MVTTNNSTESATSAIARGQVENQKQGSKPIVEQLEVGKVAMRAGGDLDLSVYGAPDPIAAQAVVAGQDAALVQQRQALSTLDRNGRLWKRDGDLFRRIEAPEARRRCLEGKPVVLLSCVSVECSESHSRGDNTNQLVSSLFGLFKSVPEYRDHSSASTKTKVVLDIAASEVTQLEDLLQANLDTVGVRGVGRVPVDGGEVTVSASFEHEWQSYSFSAKEEMGRTRVRESSRSGSERGKKAIVG